MPQEPRTEAAPPDIAAVEEALRVLGLLYGAKAALAECAAGCQDESALIRAYFLRERPHLVASYGMEPLVTLVRSTMRTHARHDPIFEQYMPRD